jgi:hypothetical protein
VIVAASNIETLVMVVFVVLVSLALVVLYYFLRQQVLLRCEHMISRWCEDKNLKLLSKHLDYFAFFRGPFALAESWYRPVYRATFQDQSGKRREATVSFGNWLTGVLSDRVIVVWDVCNSAGEMGKKRLAADMD